MFRNYLLTALRNIARHRLYSFINIAGLAVGLACVIFIILFVRDELSYDKWVPGADNLYRLELTVIIPGRPPLAMAVIPYPLPAAMKDEIPEVTAQTRLWRTGMTLMVGDRQFLENVDLVDPGFFQMIKLPLIAGDPAQVFRQPDSVVLAQSVARKYFGSTDPIGKTITTSRGQCAEDDLPCKTSTISLKVTGIARDLPHNSQLMGDIFVPNTSLVDRYSQKMKADWFSENGFGYVTLAPGANTQTVIAKMAPVFDKALNGVLRKFGIPLTGEKAYQLHLTPFAQVHLTSGRWAFNMAPPGSWTTVYGVAAIGVLILLVACFNFMNLATARALFRAREIALRKTLGASRRQLILQFLGESVLMAILALLVALALVEVLLPIFGRFLERPITLHYFTEWPLMLVILGISVAAGLVSGSYPALVLSGFRPAIVLRTNSSGQAGSGRLRNTLVVLQFAVSIGLGIAAMVVFAQISYARSIDLGFRRDNVLAVAGGMMTVAGGGKITADGHNAFVQTLRANPGIVDIAMSNYTPFENGQSLTNVVVPGQPDMIALNEIMISPNFPSFYGMKLLAGRELSDARADDKLYSSPVRLTADPRNEGHNILVNESGAARMGYTPEQAVGKTILFGQSHRTVGVLADIKFGGAREPIKPTAYTYYPDASVGLVLRLKPNLIPQTLAFVDKTWRRFAPQTAVQRAFLDESFEKLYRADERQGTMFGIFVSIAIFIACLGLFGLAAFTAGRRTKEIGVRKVFGAQTRNVVFLLLWQFSIPVLIANLIAWPIAWYYLHGWLQGFAYRIALNPLYFLGAGAVAMAIAWSTIFTHAYRVARANPINALRTE